jgi:hypothetical protein
VLTMAWFDMDATRVLEALSPPRPLAVQVRRRSQQHWSPAVILYGTSRDHEMLAGEAVPEVKLDRIVRLTIALGLRCPSEHTIKFLTSWWLYVSNERPQELSTQDKQSLLLHTKRAFDVVRRRSVVQD